MNIYNSPWLVLVPLLLLSSINNNNPPFVAHAFPTGAGACPTGKAAVGEPHLGAAGIRTIKTGSLQDGGIDLVIDRDRVRWDHPNGDLFVRVGKRSEIMLKVPYAGDGMKGFLIRLGYKPRNASLPLGRSVDLTNALSLEQSDFPGSLVWVEEPPKNETKDDDAFDTTEYELQDYAVKDEFVTEDLLAQPHIQVENNFCFEENAAGLTHTSSFVEFPRFIVKGELLVEEVIEDLVMDVTVVMANNEVISEYYYSQITFRSRIGSGNDTDVGMLESSGAISGLWASSSMILSLTTATLVGLSSLF